MITQGCAQEVNIGQGWQQGMNLFLCITWIVVHKAQHVVLGFFISAIFSKLQ
jgi:hypothetical protein